MNSTILKLMLFSCIIFQVSCDVTFKRKVKKEAEAAPVIIDEQLKTTKKVNKDKGTAKSGSAFSEKDSHTITSYYSDIANAFIRKDMIRHTQISKIQAKKLIVDKNIPRDIHVMPLPLKLERSLSSLPLHIIRVQVGTHVILMRVKSRRILDMITI